MKTQTQSEIRFRALLPADLGNRNIARANASLGEHIMKIPLNKIVERPGFNCRTDYGDIRELAASLLINGQRVPGRVDVLADGTFALVAGHRRVKAWQLAQEQTATTVFFRAVVNKVDATDTERLYDQFITQHEKPLEQYEIAEIFARLITLGHTQKEIADRTGKEPAYISGMLKYTREPAEIKAVVESGKMTVDTAIKLTGKIKNEGERIEAVTTAAKSKEEKDWEKREQAGAEADSKLIYDDDLKSYRPKETAGADDEENTVKKDPGNTKPGKKITLQEVIAGAPVYVPTLSTVRKQVEIMASQSNEMRTAEYNEGFTDCAKQILELFKTKNTILPDAAEKDTDEANTDDQQTSTDSTTDN